MSKLRLVPLLLAFAFAGLAGACAGEDEVTCTVTWSMGATELGTADIVYDGDNVDAAVEDCSIDQETHPDRPAEATAHMCECSTG